MNYEDLIKTVSEFVNNEEIYTKNMLLVYELNEERHKQMDEELYIKSNNNLNGFQHQDIIEIEIEGIQIKFIKEGTEINFD